MEIWRNFWPELKALLAEPVRYFTDPGERVFVLYLATALACAIVVYVVARWRDPARTPDRILAYLFPRRVFLHPSAKADYAFFIVDRILSFLFIPFFVILVPMVGGPVYRLLVALFGEPAQPLLAPGMATNLLVTLLSVLAVDFALWWIHYLHHRIPVLWEFHKVHHSAEVMTPLTAYRMHPVEIILNLNLTGIVSGVMIALFQYFTSHSAVIYTVVGVDIITFLFLLFGFNLRHSHIPMAYPRSLSHILVSPWMHQVHHSCEKRHIDKNMGFIFAIWDWAFGTLYVPRRGETFALGLDSGEAPKFHSVLAMYWRPFRNIISRLGHEDAADSSPKSP
ncbi:sterol desaturase family protein [Dongia rigui]|uniref:Sterol desaturase family protein n=1 Tax=Dongia rigui TaxID=940149 RepID=A0ABU5E1J4_9PROT|nr:sterol desaturase family protein [Dongia rigui]MDY0873464.1 sterol desaturase family protein [Dongia rigui]